MQRTWVKPSRTSLIVGASILLAAMLAVGFYIAASSPTPVSSQSPEYPPYESAKLFSFPGDWSQVPDATARLVYPGQASWQFVTGSLHPGSSSVLAGTSCSSCHGNPLVGESTVAGWAGPPADHGKGYGCQSCHGVLEQRVEHIGEELVELGPLENNPIEGKLPYVDVEVKAAYDDEYLYMRFEWASERPGITHDLLRWDGEKWVKWGGDKPGVTEKGILPSYEDRLTINVADSNLPAFDGAQVGFAQVGCMMTCHSSMRAMQNAPSSDEVKADPYLGSDGLGKSDVRKYLLNTRTELDESGGWNKVKSIEEIERLLEQGAFVDMLMFRAARGGPAGYADDLYVLDYRLRDDGKGPFQTQPTPPAFIYDESVAGFRAIPEDLFEEMLNSFPLILDENTAEYNPNIAFDVGDILSRRVIREPTGSAADILVNSSWQNGKWVLELRRKLDTGNLDDKAFEVGRVYYIGLAIFDDMVSNRRHHVSFPLTLGIGTDADIRAVSVR